MARDLNKSLQLRVEDAGVGLDDRNSAIEGLQSIESVVRANDSGQVQAQVLRVHVCRESVWETLLLTSWNLDGILSSCQVSDDDWVGEIGRP